MKVLFRIVAVSITVFALAGCISMVRTQRARRSSDVNSWKRVDDDQIIVVGSIDASIEDLGWRQIDNEWALYFMPYVDDARDTVNPGEVFELRFSQRGERFDIAVDAFPQIILYQPRIGGKTNRFLEGRTIIHSWRAPSLVIDIPAGTRAVYVGELFLQINEFGRIVEVRQDDDFERAEAIFHEEFGDEEPLVRTGIRFLTDEEAEAFERVLDASF